MGVWLHIFLYILSCSSTLVVLCGTCHSMVLLTALAFVVAAARPRRAIAWFLDSVNIYLKPYVAFLTLCKIKTSRIKILTKYFPATVLLLLNSRCQLPLLRPNPIDKSSATLALVRNLYLTFKIWAWMISSNFFPLLLLNLPLAEEEIRPRLTILISLPSTYMFLVAAWTTSMFRSR